MGSLFFVFKSFVLTCLVILAMQLKIGEEKVDNIVYEKIQNGDLKAWVADIKSGLKDILNDSRNEEPDESSPDEDLVTRN